MIFQAEVRQVKSLVDGTVNVTFNLPEYQLAEAQQLMALIGDMVSLDCKLLAKADDMDRKQEAED
jgi:hypothetical protein